MTEGSRVYAIGDVHGRLDLLRELHARIARDAAAFQGRKVVVYLGDYIDRGAHSRQVIEELLSSPLEAFEVVHLLGNHEQTLLDFLRYPEHAAGWLEWGGRETLASYGVDSTPGHWRDGPERLRDALIKSLPESHLDFLRGLPMSHIEGDYLFVHAGIRPGVPLGDQSASDLLWIRDEFIDSEAPHGFVIVHGHSVKQEAEMRENRIGIDTGAYFTGVLTALVLESDQRRLLQTGRAG